jgi:hypothetical protein
MVYDKKWLSDETLEREKQPNSMPRDFRAWSDSPSHIIVASWLQRISINWKRAKDRRFNRRMRMT